MTRLGEILRSLADKADGHDGRLDALEGARPKLVELWSGSLSAGSSCVLSEELEAGDIVVMMTTTSSSRSLFGIVLPGGRVDVSGVIQTASSSYLIRFVGTASGTSFAFSESFTATLNSSGNSFKKDTETIGYIGVLRSSAG